MPPTSSRRSPRFHRVIAAVWSLGTSFIIASDPPPTGFTEADLPLPTWNQEEWQKIARESAPAPLGGLLPSLGENGPTDSPPLGPALSPKYADAPPLIFPEGPEDLRAGISLFLPDGLPTQPAPTPPLRENHRPTPAMHLKDITPEFLASAQAWSGNDPLIDPLFELAETQAEDLRRFLGYHAEKADIPIVVLLLAKDERLPADVSLDTFAQGSLSARRAALLAYPISEPWRARLFLPQAAHEAVSASYLSRLVEDCLTHADTASTPEDQLHEYIVQLSIRLFWLQKELNKSKASSQAFADTAQTPPLAEVGAGVSSPAPVPSPAQTLPTFLRLPIASYVTIAILLGFLLAVASQRLVRLAKLHASHKRHRQIWTLPEIDAEPRLGGAFCGGSGAWGSWK